MLRKILYDAPRNKKTAIFAALVIIATLAAYIYYNWAGLSKLQSLEQMSSGVDLLLTDAEVREVDENGNRWELAAKKISYNIKKGCIVLEDLKARALPNKGNSVTVTSNKGLLDINKKTMLFSKSVELTTADGAKLLTSRLFYESDIKKLSSDVEVLVSATTVRVSGKGMVFFLGDKGFRILSKIKAEMGK